MSTAAVFTLYFFIAFAAGCIPFGYLLAKFLLKTDIRRHGSGNIGATNAFRVLGKGPGSAVFLLDFLKGCLPLLAYQIASGGMPHWALWVGLGAVLGHVFNPFLGFKGGKGVATGAGVVCAAYPALFLLALAVWLSSFFITRIVSLSSLLTVSALLALALFAALPKEALSFFALSFALLFWSHRQNILRLLKGEEKRI